MDSTTGTTGTTAAAGETLVLTHKWQEQGLGVAPFRAVAIISMPSPALAEANTSAYNNAMHEAGQAAAGLGVMLCQCNACGQSLMNNVVIRDARGAHFVVGLDCAAKTGDSRLIGQAELLEKRRQKALRDAKRLAAETARREAREAELAAQRARNGGLTDLELAAAAREKAAQEKAQAATLANAWLLDVLAQAYQGDFVRSIMADLRRLPLAQAVSGRALHIVAEIFGKAAGGRRGSKKYEEAEAAFYARYEAATAA